MIACISVCVCMCVCMCVSNIRLWKKQKEEWWVRRMNKRGMCGEAVWWLIKSLIKSSFFLASAWHHCLNESRERKFRALTIPWRHHTQGGMHYKTCLSFFSPLPKRFECCGLQLLPNLLNAVAEGMMALGSLFCCWWQLIRHTPECF